VFISLATVVLAALIGGPLALVFSRFHFPGRRLAAALAVLPVVLPPLVGVLAFFFLFGESGILPRGVQALFRLDHVPFALDGVPAILVVHAYTLSVYFYLFLSSALRELDPAVTEAGLNLGASPWRGFWKITLPLLTPALVGASLLVFMSSMASFSAPFIFASGFRMLTLEIYNTKLNGDLPMATTQTVILSLLSIAFLLVLRGYSGRRVYTGSVKGARRPPRVITRGTGRVLLAGFGLLCVAGLVLPHLTVILISFVRDGSWTWQVLPPEYTEENYLRLFRDSKVLEPVVNSLKMASLATVGNVILGILAAYLLAKSSLRWKKLWEVLIMIPWALPGTAVAMNLIVAFSQPTPLTAGRVLVGTFWILPLAYFLRHLPLVFRASYAALEQVDDSLTEAARGLGASGWFSFRKVLLPLVMPGVVAGALLAFVLSLGELVSSILLYTYANRPLSVEIISQLRLFNLGSAAAYGVFLLVLISIALVVGRHFLELRPGGVAL